MKITINEYGGFGGMRQTWSVDSADLPPDAQPRLDALIAEASREPSSSPAADAKSYVVRIDDGGEERVLRQRDPRPPAFSNLLAYLRPYASRGAGSE